MSTSTTTTATATATALAALTTIFTPSCSTSWLLTSSKAASQFPPFPTSGAASCDPPQWTANLNARGFSFYSPAICPDGFYVGPGCQISSQPKTSEGFAAIQPGETAAFCVPSGQTCTSDATDFRGGFWGATSDDDESSFTVGPAMQIRWRSSDLSSLETHPLTPGQTLATVASAAVTTSASDSSATSTTASPSRPSSLAQPTSTSGSTTLNTAVDAGTALATGSGAATSGGSFASASSVVSAPATSVLPPLASASSPARLESGDALDGGLIAVVASVLTIAVAVCIFMVFQVRSRWQMGSLTLPWRRGRPKGLVRVGLGAWVGTRAGDEEDQMHARSRDDGSISSAHRNTHMSIPTVVIHDSGPSGSSEDPAELDAEETQVYPQRGSWVSRILSRVALSSVGTRSSSQSRWTQRSLARSAGWEPFPEEKEEGEESGLEVLAVPKRAVHSRPRTASSSYPDETHELPAGLTFPRLVVRSRSFDRLSTGTFGNVIVRDRSPSSRQSIKD